MNLQTVFGLFQSRETKQFPRSEAQPAINCSTYSPLNQVALGGSTTPTRTVACLPHPPSPTQTDVSLVRRHAHPDQQPCDGARSSSAEGSQKIIKPPLKLLNTLPVTLNSIVIVVPTVLQQETHPLLVGETREHAPCCFVTLPAVKAAFA